ncbi:hypothetical protein BH11ACT4_BH11ACT4_16160 [soil metagenome]
MNLSNVSIGLVGATPHDVLRTLGPQIEAAGFRGLWLNDGPDGDSISGLRAVAEVTTTLRLSTGVIPLDRRSAPEILADLHGLPLDRVAIGVGSGGPKNALARVAEAVEILRPEVTVLVGALGPKMRALGAAKADGILLSWLTPDDARDAMADLRRDAAGNAARGVLYARTAVDTASLPVLRAEADRYASYPQYAANFERLGLDPIDAAIDGTAGLSARVDEYAAIVDELVLRAITEDATLATYQRFIGTVAAG